MKKTFFLIVALTLLINACKKHKPDPQDDPAQSYDQVPMFQHYSGNLIVPAYASLKIKTDSLFQAIQTFNASVTLVNLNAVRLGFKSAYKQFMYVSPYDFGPAGSVYFRSSSNIFPTDSTQINGNISSGTYNLDDDTQADAIGFPAMDYLLYGYNKSDLYILNLFITSSNRRQYLYDVCDHYRQQLATIVSQWNTYTGTFNGATGNSAGGSLSNLVNQMNFDFEITKNARLGIPLGKQTLGVALPDKCEAYYSQYSLILLLESVKALENIYLGRSQSGADGKGLDDYLVYLGKTDLDHSIKTKFSELKNIIATIPGPLSTTVVSSPANSNSAYAKFQELLVLLKSDLPSALSVSITYTDGDGD